MRQATFSFIDLFAGIGGFHLAAKQNGGHCVFASEIDPASKIAYEHNYGIQPFGDITKVSVKEIPDHEILLAGFPCQPFSIIGKQLGFDDMRGTLFYEIARILKSKKPPVVVLENVKQFASHNNGDTIKQVISTLENFGYKTKCTILNALHYGLPQKRERAIIVGFLDHAVDFKWPKRKGSYRGLDRIIEKNVSDKYFVSERIRKKREDSHKSKHRLGIWHENKSGNISSYPYSCALRAGASYNYLLVNGERRLTPREMLRLQGFPDSFEIVCSDSQTRKQAGNAVPVPMIKAVIKEVLNATTKSEGWERINQPGIVPSWNNSKRNNFRNKSMVCL